MARHLTSTKLCVLVLIDLYIAGKTSSGSRMEILSFIAASLHLPSNSDDPGLETRFRLASSEISALSDIASKWQSDVPGRTVYDVLLTQIWSWDGLDSLYGFFEHLYEVVDSSLPAKLSRTSPLGQFIRRCCVQHARLQFSDSDALWKAFAAYRQPSHTYWAQRNPEAARRRDHDEPAWAQAQASLERGHLPIASGLNAEDTDALLRFAIYKLQKFGARAPGDLRSKIDGWFDRTQDASEQSLQQFLAFFDYWKAGQLTMAQESLQRYFDYSLMKQSGSDMKQFYQYALLHKSVLHSDFEQWEESVDAMDECIATARENQDTVCLNFALSWLMFLRQAYPKTNKSSLQGLARLVGGGNGEQDEIAFLKNKAQEGKHWSLLSSTLLEEAKFEIHGAGPTPKALEFIMQASYLNMKHDLYSLIPASELFLGSSYDRLGQAHLSQRVYDQIRLVHNPHSPLNDRMRSNCRIAYGTAMSGRHKHAVQILQDMHPATQGVLKLEQRHQAFGSLLMMHRHLHHNNLEAARNILTQLKPICNFGDSEIAFEVQLAEIELFTKLKHFSVAMEKVNAQLELLRKNRGSDIAQYIHFLIVKAKTFLTAGEPISGFSLALRATEMSMKLMLISELVDGLSVLAQILMDGLQEYEAAADLIEAVLPYALESTELLVTSELLLRLSDAKVALSVSQAPAEQEATLWLASHYASQSKAGNSSVLTFFSEPGYESLENFTGQCGALRRKSKIALFQQDEASASRANDMYEQLVKTWATWLAGTPRLNGPSLDNGHDHRNALASERV